MNVFDQIAQRYDSPKQLELANIITKEIKTELGDTTGKTALDYGCGTGLIGLQISDEFKEMLFVDPSKEMIHVVDQKIAQMNRTNVKTVVGSFANEETLNIKADLIIVSLVLLHVPDTLDSLKSLYRALNSKGHILVVDFDKNENINHEKVHNGFSQLELKKQLEKIGFKSVSSRTFYHGQNIFMNQDASMFILNAEK
ncbi:class I SAM-dependent methyltransferase [Enterococcus crotali]|uniref:class I SAM-dependent methyltransferase n=1 Tax=Enterococcus crotali TaxID=1453587 RepID=UPI00046ECCD0|nr:class I SAM-dependent methyltransferase [Enterococcus crotali]